MIRSVQQYLVSLAVLGMCAVGFAQEQPAPSAHPAPTLERINVETQSLFEAIRPGLVQVQLPVPKWLAQIGDPDNPINHWQLDPSVRAALEQQQMKGANAQAKISPSTQPGRQSSPSTQPNDHWQMTMVQRADGSVEFVAPNEAPSDSVIGAIVAPRSLGIVYDDQGHVVIPVYIEKEAIEEQQASLNVFSLAGGASRAKFVGSDRQTNITVLKLDQPLGRAAPFAGQRPHDGALVLMLAQNGDGGRLAVWTRTQQDRALAVDVRGRVSGFARMGQFLDAELARPVIDQLIQFGRVKRATLGVLVTEAEAPDGRRAMHVDQVKKDSAAETAGIHEGDYILSLAGNPVDDLPNFAAAISMSNGVTTMQILRAGKTIDLQVNLQQK